MRNRHRIRRILHQNMHNTSPQSVVEKSKFNWLDTSLIIGFITALGYFVAYSFKKGYLNYFGISEIFLKQIDIIIVIISISIVGTLLFYLYSIYNNLSKVLEQFNNPYTKLFKEAFLPFLVLGLPSAIFLSDSIKVVLIILSIYLVLIYILPIIKFKDVRGYKNKIEKELISLDEEGFTLKNIMFAFRNLPSSRIFLTIVTFLIMQPTVHLIGHMNAELERKFYVLDIKGHNYLVIDKFGDNFIIAPYDTKKNTMKQEFQIIEIKSDFDSPLVYKKIILPDKIKFIQDKSNKN
ncbi:hypothetical protein QNH39_18800 [Neobacillus novalis]|uniref:Uncharacterized protein n=1 Tax=Neobacillus novalis TaxID=220687 RepID=A0AA95MMM7_9BACI|nr:hypothetical protein [Neobacillus novalis]WHY84685.1 hypothetical protein QNH39_18800 [Neobacillus novalis]